MSDSDNVKEALSTTKDEVSNEFSRMSLIEDANLELQNQISELISLNNEKELAIRAKENNRHEFKERLEMEQHNFYLKFTSLSTKLDKALSKEYEKFHRFDDQSLILAQKSDYNQQLINHMKSQENEYQHLEELYGNQIAQTESMIQSISNINSSSGIYQSIDNLKTLEIPKVKCEIDDVKRNIEQIDQKLSKLKFEKSKLNDKGQSIRNQITNPNNPILEKYNDKIEMIKLNSKQENDKIAESNNNVSRLDQKLNRLKRKIQNIDDNQKEIASSIKNQNDKTQFKANRLKEIKDESKGMKLNTQNLKDQMEKLDKKYEKYEKIHKEKNECIAELKDKVDEVSNAHKVIKKLKQIIPQLIEYSTQTDMKYHSMKHEIDNIENELSQKPIDHKTIKRQIKESTETLNKIEEQIQEKKKENETYELMMENNNSNYLDDSLIDNPMIIESDYEFKLKNKINKVNKQILKTKKKIKKANCALSKLKYSQKVLNKIMTKTQNQNNEYGRIHDDFNNPIYQFGKSEKSTKLENEINNLQIRINSKKNVISEMQSNFYKQSSLLIHTFHNCNKNELASTMSINQDLITKSILLKNHDPSCCVGHECAVYQMSKNSTPKDPFYNSTNNYPVV